MRGGKLQKRSSPEISSRSRSTTCGKYNSAAWKKKQCDVPSPTSRRHDVGEQASFTGGLSPEARITVNGRKEDARAMANSNPLPVPAVAPYVSS